MTDDIPQEFDKKAMENAAQNNEGGTEFKVSPSIDDLSEVLNIQSGLPNDFPDGWAQRNDVAVLLLKRLFTTRISSIRLLTDEQDTVMGEKSKLKVTILPRAAQVLAWRRTCLRTGAFFYLLMTCTDISGFLTNLIAGYKSLYGGSLPERYQKHFIGVLMLQYVFQAGVLVGNLCSVWYAAKAAVGWWSFRHSKTKVAMAFLFSYAPNFLLLLILPWNSAVNFVGVQQQICRDIIDPPEGISMLPLWPSALENNTFAQQLWMSYQIDIPDNFCDGEPTKYTDELTKLLEEAGRIEVDGTCPAVKNFIKKSLGGEIGSLKNCPPKCTDCVEGPCMSHLMGLSSMAGMFGPSALTNPSLPKVQRDCAYCIQPSNHDGKNGFGCADTCPAVFTAVLAKVPASSAAMAEVKKQQGDKVQSLHDIVTLLPQCARPEDMRSLSMLSRLILATQQWKILLGAKYGGESILKLLPLSFSIMLGSWKAAGISKSIVPYSRMPGFASGASVLFTVPFIIQIVVVIQNVMGTVLSLLAFICLLAAILINFPMRIPMLKLVGIIEPLNHDDAFFETRQIKRIRMISALSGIILLVVYMTTNELFQVGAELAKETGYEVPAEDKARVREMIIQSSINFAAATLGKALISTVFFVDCCLLMMHIFDRKDSEKVEAARDILMQHVHGLFGMQKGPANYESQVSPFEECETDPTEHLTLKALKEKGKEKVKKMRGPKGTGDNHAQVSPA